MPDLILKFHFRSVVEKILSLQPMQADQLPDSLAEQGFLFIGDVFHKSVN